MRILYLSRGRGYGHAVADIQISKWLKEMFSDIEIIFASYEDGVFLLENSGFHFVKMNVTLETEMETTTMVPEINRLIDSISPDVILSHEVFMAGSVAKFRSVPCFLFTHWFFTELSENHGRIHPIDRMMSFYDKVLFLDVEPFHNVPLLIRNRVNFIGPIIREGLTNNSNHIEGSSDILITLGGKTSAFVDEVTKILDALLILTKKQREEYKITLLVPSMKSHFQEYVNTLGLQRVEVKDFEPNILSLIKSTSLVIGRGSFSTLAELAVTGKPSLHLVSGDNPVDELHIHNFHTLGTVKWAYTYDQNAESISELIKSSMEWSQNNIREIKEAGSIYRRCNPRAEIETILGKVVNKLSSDR